jgi:hypothetical protein
MDSGALDEQQGYGIDCEKLTSSIEPTDGCECHFFVNASQRPMRLFVGPRNPHDFTESNRSQKVNSSPAQRVE